MRDRDRYADEDRAVLYEVMAIRWVAAQDGCLIHDVTLDVLARMRDLHARRIEPTTDADRAALAILASDGTDDGEPFDRAEAERAGGEGGGTGGGRAGIEAGDATR